MPTAHDIGIFDLETTGVDPAADRIVTAYVGRLAPDGSVVSGREWLIAPDGFVIPDTATAVHGISTEHALEHGRPFADVLPEILDALAELADDGVPVTAHNASYDFTMLAHEMERLGHTDPVAFIETIDVVDTFVLDKQADRYRPGKRTLTAIAPLYDVTLTEDEAHGAAADAIAAGRIALNMLGRPDFRGVPFKNLARLQKAWAREQRASFIAYRRENGDPDFTVDMNWPLYDTALALRVPEPVYTF